MFRLPRAKDTMIKGVITNLEIVILLGNDIWINNNLAPFALQVAKLVEGGFEKNIK